MKRVPLTQENVNAIKAKILEGLVTQGMKVEQNQFAPSIDGLLAYLRVYEELGRRSRVRISFRICVLGTTKQWIERKNGFDIPQIVKEIGDIIDTAKAKRHCEEVRDQKKVDAHRLADEFNRVIDTPDVRVQVEPLSLRLVIVVSPKDPVRFGAVLEAVKNALKQYG